MGRKISENDNFFSSYDKIIFSNYDNVKIECDSLKENIFFNFPFLLPHTVRSDRNIIVRNSYNRDLLFKCFRNVSEDFVLTNNIQMFDKALLSISFYMTKNKVTDLDNIDLKYFIDGAIKPFVVDDDAFHLFLSLNAFPSDKEMTKAVLSKIF